MAPKLFFSHFAACGTKVEWTVEVKSVGDVQSACIADLTKQSPECGYIVKNWFPISGGSGHVTVISEIWNPPTNSNVQKMALRFDTWDASSTNF
jgi:hypothetical protein